MSKYLFLQDHSIGGQYFPAGSVGTTADVPGGTLPIGWVPTAAVDPLDTPAVNAFFANGPKFPTLIFVKPVTYWVSAAKGFVLVSELSGLPLTSELSGAILTTDNYVAPGGYSLTGLGIGLGVINV